MSSTARQHDAAFDQFKAAVGAGVYWLSGARPILPGARYLLPSGVAERGGVKHFREFDDGVALPIGSRCAESGGFNDANCHEGIPCE